MTNLFSKGSSIPVVSIGKFLSQLYVITQLRRAISSWHLFQRFNLSQVVLKTNTYKAKTSYYASRRVVRANRSEDIIRLSEVHSILVSRKCEVHVTPKVKDYATLIINKSKLIQSNNISNLTLIVSKYNNVIPYKFKVVKFML